MRPGSWGAAGFGPPRMGLEMVLQNSPLDISECNRYGWKSANHTLVANRVLSEGNSIMSGHARSTRGEIAGATPNVGFGRYGRMFELGPANRLPPNALNEIAQAMIKTDAGKGITESDWMDENPTIPAGYTYFGQFVAHDITFDPTPLSAAELDVSALVDYRTPALDLACMYGRGPDDQPYLYYGFSPADGRQLKLRMGQEIKSAGAAFRTRHDVLRLTDPAWQFMDDRDGVAILGDKRNDENKIVSQLHGALIEFHNKVVANDALLAAFAGDLSGDARRFHDDARRFRVAAMLVRWHYQWVVVHDFLDRICMPGIKDEVLNAGGTPRLGYYRKPAAHFAYMPVEFSGAAYRFGHSMVRPSYTLNQFIGVGDTRIATFSSGTNNLNGFSGTMPDYWDIDWGYFLDGLSPTAPAGFKVPQPSYRIDALLAQPLADLPKSIVENSPVDNPLYINLACRDLERGQMLGLPSGQAVARALGIVPLPDDILWGAGSRVLDLGQLNCAQLAAFRKVQQRRAMVKINWVDRHEHVLEGNTPLWYYILREAEYYGVEKCPSDPGVGLGGQHLGPVGSRIVAETLIGLLWYDRSSFLHALRGFRPMPQIVDGASSVAGSAPNHRHFSLDRLIAYALT